MGEGGKEGLEMFGTGIAWTGVVWKGFRYAVLSENHSLPRWLCWLGRLIPQRKPGLSLIQRNGSNLATSFSEYT